MKALSEAEDILGEEVARLERKLAQKKQVLAQITSALEQHREELAQVVSLDKLLFSSYFEETGVLCLQAVDSAVWDHTKIAFRKKRHLMDVWIGWKFSEKGDPRILITPFDIRSSWSAEAFRIGYVLKMRNERFSYSTKYKPEVIAGKVVASATHLVNLLKGNYCPGRIIARALGDLMNNKHFTEEEGELIREGMLPLINECKKSQIL